MIGLSLSSVGLGLSGTSARPELGPELVTNGGFSVGTGWPGMPAGATISGGVLNGGGAIGYVWQSGPGFTAGATYRFTLTISGYVSGEVKAYGNAAPTFSAIFTGNGIKTQDIVIPNADGEQGLQLNGFVGAVDDLSIRKVL